MIYFKLKNRIDTLKSIKEGTKLVFREFGKVETREVVKIKIGTQANKKTIEYVLDNGSVKNPENIFAGSWDILIATRFCQTCKMPAPRAYLTEWEGQSEVSPLCDKCAKTYKKRGAIQENIN